MELKPVDHLLVGILLILLPLKGIVDYRRMLGWLNAGRAGARLTFYRTTIAEEWVLSIAVIVFWVAYARGFPLLGFTVGAGTGVGFWIAVGVTVVVCGVLIIQASALFRDEEKLKMAALQFEPLQAMVPRTGEEMRTYGVMAVTAGICEEILYRGFLLAYFTSLITFWGVWPAVILSSLIFGLAHAYQGPRGVFKAGTFGLVMAGIYLLGGTIWIVMLLHAVVDLVNGNIGRHSFAACEARVE